MAGAGLNEGQKTIVRYVLYPSNPKITIDSFPWRTGDTAFVVYRGQSSDPKMKSSVGEGARNPLTIETTRGRPLSTSHELRDRILTFAKGYDATPPSGRVFQITLEPGVRFVDIPEERKSMNLEPESFQFLKDELLAQAAAESDETKKAALTAYAGKSVQDLRGLFFAYSLPENEVLVDPRNTVIEVSETPVEADSNVYGSRIKLVDGKPVFNEKGEKKRESFVKGTVKVPVYPTTLRSNPAGGRRRGYRGRTFRRKPMRRNKNGSRLARQSKRRRWNGHA